ncbi:MAG: hypothetical protein JWM24_1656 [Solirubrobacterales bacterium]|nr:hypothetical protein [Solirubrobacterales bacterium]
MTRRLQLLAILTALSIWSGAASAQANSPIEGVWTFNGGKVAVQAQEDGTFRGVVVAPTKFSQCFHPVGQTMWSEIRQQPDGSYWGLHQWYFATDECVPNPELGLTAWRVNTAADGSKSLEVCFSEPPSKSQPTIAPDGTAKGATYDCNSSARISALPSVEPTDAAKYILLPGNGLCLSRKKLRLRLRDPAGDPIVKANVRLHSGKIHRRAKLKRKSNGIVAMLNLAGLTLPKFRVTVGLTTALGNHLRSNRTYRLCAQPRKRKHRHRKQHS